MTLYSNKADELNQKIGINLYKDEIYSRESRELTKDEQETSEISFERSQLEKKIFEGMML